MKSELKQAFDPIHASEELKEHTRAFLQQRTRRRPRRAVLTAVCALFLLMVLGASGLYFSPVAVVSVDVNPSLELSVNRFDRVIAVKGRNEDGIALAEAVPLRMLNYVQAVERLLDSEEMQVYLSQDASLSIGVIGDNSRRCDAMRMQLESCSTDWNAHCYTAGNEELEQAHALGLSCGKYRAFLQVQALDPEITPEQIQSMTMREIRALLNQLTPQSDRTGEHHHGAGGGHGRTE